MDMEEAASHGAAMKSALLSPKFRIQTTFNIIETVMYPIKISWESDASYVLLVASSSSSSSSSSPLTVSVVVIFGTARRPHLFWVCHHCPPFHLWRV